MTELISSIRTEGSLQVLLKAMQLCPSARTVVDAAMERCLELMASDSKIVLEFVASFELLSCIHTTLSEALERAILQSTQCSEIHLALLVCHFAKPDARCYTLWISVLNQYKDTLGKMSMAAGGLLGRMDGDLARRFKHFLLSFAESQSLSHEFSLFIALLLASNRQIPRSDIVGELLMLAAVLVTLSLLGLFGCRSRVTASLSST